MSKIISRAYNTFEVNELYGEIKKSSINDKIVDEYIYYRAIPKKFQIFFPRLIDGSPDERWFVLEKYDYPNLGQHIMGDTESSLKYYDWEDVLLHLKMILNLWSIEESEKGDANDAHSMYISKTLNEYYKFVAQNHWPQLFNTKTILINDLEYKNFESIWVDIVSYIKSSLIPSYTRSFIHGDFCFANILLGGDNTLRFVDPRGSFGNKVGCFGDQRYDVAKLYHSVDSGYEFLNSNSFTLKIEENNFKYSLMNDYYKSKVLSIFKKIFFEFNNSFSEKEITMIEGLIFVGACARHYENLDRQAVMYLIGIEKLNKALSIS